MFVPASTDCFPDLSHAAAIDRLGDLEYTAVEPRSSKTAINSPSYIANLEQAIDLCRNTRHSMGRLRFADHGHRRSPLRTSCRLPASRRP